MRHVALLLVLSASTSAAPHACEYVEPVPSEDAADASPTVCAVDPQTLEVTDPCPAGERCVYGAPPDIGWHIGVCR